MPVSTVSRIRRLECCVGCADDGVIQHFRRLRAIFFKSWAAVGGIPVFCGTQNDGRMDSLSQRVLFLPNQNRTSFSLVRAPNTRKRWLTSNAKRGKSASSHGCHHRHILTSIVGIGDASARDATVVGGGRSFRSWNLSKSTRNEGASPGFGSPSTTITYPTACF